MKDSQQPVGTLLAGTSSTNPTNASSSYTSSSSASSSSRKEISALNSFDCETAYLEEVFLRSEPASSTFSPLDDELSLSSSEPLVSEGAESPSSRSDSRSSASSFDEHFPRVFQPLITQDDVFVSFASERLSPDNLQLTHSHSQNQTPSHTHFGGPLSRKSQPCFSPTPSLAREMMFQGIHQDVSFLESLWDLYPDYMDDLERPCRKRKAVQPDVPLFTSSSTSLAAISSSSSSSILSPSVTPASATCTSLSRPCTDDMCSGQCGGHSGPSAIQRRHSSSMPPADSQSVEEKRAILNVLERVRREDLKSSFHRLRDSLPDLTGNSRAPKGLILKRASEYIIALKAEHDALEAKLQALKSENSRLSHVVNPQSINNDHINSESSGTECEPSDEAAEVVANALTSLSPIPHFDSNSAFPLNSGTLLQVASIN